MTVTELPHPQPAPRQDDVARWIPERAGILNVWRYYDETFTFHDGRLLLRGPNGTGKSKALELLLPFLFDASLRPNRLSTFGTSERTMHWNLMGEGASGATRVGYVWLEFRHHEQWFTCGARLAATTHTTTVHPDYFTTSQRIGLPDGLSLTTAAGQPLTKTALEEALGDHGTLHPNAAEYRAAVRGTLFPGLSEQRYDALITALLQLRMPKLSQRLDPSLLSSLLSKALPPLGEAEISELAEGFERLDRQREQLRKLDAEVEAAQALKDKQRAYAQRVLRAGAAALISATTEMDKISSAAKQSEEEYHLAVARKQEADQRGVELAHQAEHLEGRIDGLVTSEAYRDGQKLDELRVRTRQARQTAEALRVDATRLRTAADEDEAEARDATEHAESWTATTRNLADDVLLAARQVRLTSLHDEITAIPSETANARNLLRAGVQSRHDEIADVVSSLNSHDEAVRGRRAAETAVEDARADLAAAATEHTELARQHESTVAALATAVRDWASGCRELVFDQPDALADLVESEAAILAAMDAVARSVLHTITRQETLVETTRSAALRAKTELITEIRDLENRLDLPPEAPLSRTADRDELTGAPLWRLVHFADTVPDETRAAVEAALEASGLLDAWVGHDGTVPGHDTFADPDLVPVAPGRSLAEVLVPEPDAAVPPDTIDRLLNAIAYEDHLPEGHPVAISADGHWRLANLHGSWAKDEAAYIGALARERARQKRMDDLRDQVIHLDMEIAEDETTLRHLASRRALLDAEKSARPSHAALNDVVSRLADAQAAVNAADTIVRRALDTLSRSENEVNTTLRTLAATAAERGLPTDRAALTAVSKAVTEFHARAESWIDAQAQLISVQQTAERLAAQAGRSHSIATQRESEADTAEAHVRKISSALDAIEQTAGATYREVLEELEALRAKASSVKRETSENHRAVTDLAQALGALDSTRQAQAVQRDEATKTRDRVAERFRHLATASFPADAGIDLPAVSTGVRAVLEAARTVAATWPSLPHSPKNLVDAAHRLSESVHMSRAVLSARADLELTADEEIQVFSAMADGVRIGATALHDLLRAEAEHSREDITAKERDLFDKTLTGDTRRHLAARIRQAHDLVDNMNARLERVRTASKVAVRLVWEVSPDLPAGTRTARDLLLRDPVRLTEQDRESLHKFFRERIEQAKQNDTATTWEQQLGQVFDYTAWHRFVVKLDRDNGTGWQPLTKKLHGALSGGEKAIALHLPLFAAVAAHYQAVPQAPRIILLDEVFVGVDTTNRGQVFHLLATLDLDLILTSDHEWCTYRELPGIAIHQLMTADDGDEAVTTARFTWNGQEITTTEP